MSFNDLERGAYAATGAGGVPDEERQYRRRVQELSRKVFQINASVANIRQLVSQLGTQRDTSRLRQDIHAKMEDTRELVKHTGAELKALAAAPAGAGDSRRRARRLEQQKLAADFQKVLEQFQNIQRVSAEVSREYVDRARHARADHPDLADEHQESTPLLQQQQQQQQYHHRVELSVLDNDVEYNEALIIERESEINEIEQGIVELNEIFRDLGSIVTEQQTLFDSIESNIQSVATNTRGAADELHTADEYQRRAGKLQFCIILFAIIFVLVLLLIAIE